LKNINFSQWKTWTFTEASLKTSFAQAAATIAFVAAIAGMIRFATPYTQQLSGHMEFHIKNNLLLQLHTI